MQSNSRIIHQTYTQYENQFEWVIIAILKAFAAKHEHKTIWRCFKYLRLQLLHSEKKCFFLGTMLRLILILCFTAFNNKWHSLVLFQSVFFFFFFFRKELFLDISAWWFCSFLLHHITPMCFLQSVNMHSLEAIKSSYRSLLIKTGLVKVEFYKKLSGLTNFLRERKLQCQYNNKVYNEQNKSTYFMYINMLM